MNLALNRVTMRSINTSVTSAIPVVSLLVVGSLAMGAAPLQEFAVALLVGIVVGSYSSLFLAASLVSRLKEGEERWQAVASKVRGRVGEEGPTRVIGRQEAVLSDTRAAPRRTRRKARPGRRRGPTSQACKARTPRCLFGRSSPEMCRLGTLRTRSWWPSPARSRGTSRSPARGNMSAIA